MAAYYKLLNAKFPSTIKQSVPDIIRKSPRPGDPGSGLSFRINFLLVTDYMPQTKTQVLGTDC